MAPPPTVHWRPNEASLNRSSFNAMVMGRKPDVTEIMVRTTTMGQASMMGPGWEPSAIVTRRIAEALTNPDGAKTGLPGLGSGRGMSRNTSAPLLSGAMLSLSSPMPNHMMAP
eukprot:TRINITY_DN125259_c0_g1_i1.p2 TRINITY_DN125259_c0_g1~~TRINITY_DN125259_c0_g1_i1.p2  ORF type:complete len:113 (-),score=12.85 TRINITY_DN125259_c0_g1_i1:318-656(-)